MVQEFVVLRCKQCLNFQSHVSRKSNKFVCDICHTSQPIQRIWKSGLSTECQQVLRFLEEKVETGAEDEEAENVLYRFEDKMHRRMIKELDPDVAFDEESTEKTEESQEDDEDDLYRNLQDPDEVMGDDFLEEVTPSTETTDDTPEPSPPDGRDEGFVDEHSRSHVIISEEAKNRIMNGVHHESQSFHKSVAVIPPKIVIHLPQNLSPYTNGSSFNGRHVPIDYSTNGHSVNGKMSPLNGIHEPLPLMSGYDDSPAAKKGKYDQPQATN
jgi:hypothetical protein